MKASPADLAYLQGLLRIDKPLGMTSHDVVAQVRGLCGLKVGHGGTLDPQASGLLVLLVGTATSFSRYLLEGTKIYAGEVTLGVATDTWDAEGTVTREEPVPSLPEGYIEQLKTILIGERDYPLPPYSAKREGGQKRYELARMGMEVAEREIRSTVHDLAIEQIHDGRLSFAVACSGGTYVRSIAVVMAEALGTIGHLSSLRRLQSGNLRVDGAVTLEALRTMPLQSWPIESVRNLFMASSYLELEEADLVHIHHGALPPFMNSKPFWAGHLLVGDEEGRIHAVLHFDPADPEQKVRFERVLEPPCN